MNVSDYTYLMNKPDAITEKQADALGSVLNEFPYFQSARALRLKGLYNQNSFKYNYALKVTAAYTSDRSVLFDFITSEAFTSIQNDFYEQKLRDLLEITVFDSEIISPEQIQKAIEVKADIEKQPFLEAIKEAQISVIETPSVVQSVQIEDSVKTEELVQAEEIKAQEPIIIEEPKKLPEIDPSIFLAIKEAQTVTFEKPIIKEEELKPIPEIDFSIFAAIKEAQTVTFEKPELLPQIDLSTLTAIKAAQNVTFEKPVIEEEKKVDSVELSNSHDAEEVERASFSEPTQTEEPKIDRVENSILNSIKVSETLSAPEPLGTKELKEEPKNERIENSILSSIKEAEATIEQPVKTEEAKADPIIEEPAVEKPSLNSVEEEEDDSVIEEMIIPEFKMNTVERSILSSIKESETKAPTEPKEETQEVIKSEDKEEEIKEENEETIEEIIEEEESNEPAKTAAEHLEIGKPLDFSLSEKHSFQEWLQLSRTEPIDRSSELSPEEQEAERARQEQLIIEEKQKKAEIIDKFIVSNPKISPIKPGNNAPAVQIESGPEDNSYLMTETLARVYLEQKKYTKAIQAYEILILKYPEKITFFADRISDIKILQQNNNNNN